MHINDKGPEFSNKKKQSNHKPPCQIKITRLNIELGYVTYYFEA